RISSLEVRDDIERRAYEIALASLEEEPVAWLHSENGLGIPAITRSKNIADSWLSKGWYVQPLYIAKPVPVVPDARPSLNNGIVGFDEGWNACRAAMLHGAEPVNQTYKSPHTQFEQVADLYEMQFDDGRTCAFHTDAQKAAQWLQVCDGNRVQEYVKLERLQNALSGNSPVSPGGWISCSERMPNDKQYVWCWGKSYGWTECDTFEGYYDWSRNKWWAVTDNEEEQASKVTHWMPLPEPPQEVK
ncbi:Valyl-tRNA synthetase, partial [Escherichia coli PCN079]